MFATHPDMAKRWVKETPSQTALPNKVGTDKVATALMKGSSGKKRIID